MKHTAACLLLLSLLPGAYASTERPLVDIKRDVADAVEKYVNLVACPGVKVGTYDVMRLKPADSSEQATRFAVLWQGDPDCGGEEGTHIAIASLDEGNYVVDPRLSSHVAEFDGAARYVRRVVSHTADSLTLEGKDYGPYDTTTPSIPVRFILRLDDKGNWKVAEKILLPMSL